MALITVLNAHKLDKLFNCEQCKYTTTKQRYLAKHKRIHEEKLFSCDVCDYKAHTNRLLKSHNLRHIGARQFYCNQCDYQTFQRRNFMIHQKTHKLDKAKLTEYWELFYCDQCQFKSPFKSVLDSHLKRHKLDHNVSSQDVITNTSETSKTKQQNIQPDAIAKQTNNELGHKHFQCDLCDFKGSKRAEIHNHLKLHASSRPNLCEANNFQNSSKKFYQHATKRENKYEVHYMLEPYDSDEDDEWEIEIDISESYLIVYHNMKLINDLKPSSVDLLTWWKNCQKPYQEFRNESWNPDKSSSSLNQSQEGSSDYLQGNDKIHGNAIGQHHQIISMETLENDLFYGTEASTMNFLEVNMCQDSTETNNINHLESYLFEGQETNKLSHIENDLHHGTEVGTMNLIESDLCRDTTEVSTLNLIENDLCRDTTKVSNINNFESDMYQGVKTSNKKYSPHKKENIKKEKEMGNYLEKAVHQSTKTNLMHSKQNPIYQGTQTCYTNYLENVSYQGTENIYAHNFESSLHQGTVVNSVTPFETTLPKPSQKNIVKPLETSPSITSQSSSVQTLQVDLQPSTDTWTTKSLDSDVCQPLDCTFAPSEVLYDFNEQNDCLALEDPLTFLQFRHKKFDFLRLSNAS